MKFPVKATEKKSNFATKVYPICHQAKKYARKDIKKKILLKKIKILSSQIFHFNAI